MATPKLSSWLVPTAETLEAMFTRDFPDGESCTYYVGQCFPIGDLQIWSVGLLRYSDKIFI